MDKDLADALNWRSLRWQDGCTYEGLEASGACESHGVVRWPHRRERYEGQLRGSRPHGYGAYRWRDGTLYRGEWFDGQVQGCGVMIWKDELGAVQAKAGKFFDDGYVGPVPGCSAEAAHEAALEADVAAGRARLFETQHSRRHSASTAAAPAGAAAAAATVTTSAAAAAAAAAVSAAAPTFGAAAALSGRGSRSVSGVGGMGGWAGPRLSGAGAEAGGGDGAEAGGVKSGWPGGASWGALRRMHRAHAEARVWEQAKHYDGGGVGRGSAGARGIGIGGQIGRGERREHIGESGFRVLGLGRGGGGGGEGAEDGEGGGGGDAVSHLTVEQRRRLERILAAELLPGLAATGGPTGGSMTAAAGGGGGGARRGGAASVTPPEQ